MNVILLLTLNTNIANYYFYFIGSFHLLVVAAVCVSLPLHFLFSLGPLTFHIIIRVNK